MMRISEEIVFENIRQRIGLFFLLAGGCFLDASLYRLILTESSESLSFPPWTPQ